jgi:hypothetical protein
MGLKYSLIPDILGMGGESVFERPREVLTAVKKPGDLLHGDENGLVSIPLDIGEAVAARAASSREAEAEYFDFLGNNFSFEELKKRLGIH